MARLRNPLAFTPAPVTFFVGVIYVALLAVLLVDHHVLPSIPKKTPKGTDLTAAWSDLQNLTTYYHPYNSHANDDARTFLLNRIHAILEGNKVNYVTERDRSSKSEVPEVTDSTTAVLIDDLRSNVTTASGALSVYFEGSNIIVSIKGTESNGHCYLEPKTSGPSTIKGGVLVNAHFDSVSTGFGATDDGVGVVTILQLLSFFTTPGNEPKRCVVLLLNNGEEDYLNGARAFMRHPVSQTPHTFLNLEGAGAGGKAILFRATDTEVTRFYRQAEHPAGTAIIADGFARGLIRSQTDYVVFNGDLGLRGLDVAFFEPRSKYHTMQDSTIETSKKSVWHMLSASISTVKALASDTSDEFSGKPKDGRVDSGQGTRGVYFDLFGRELAVFELHSLFAWSVTLLVFTPILFIVLLVLLTRAEKNYMLTRREWLPPDANSNEHYIPINGWRGVFRFPITIAIATAAVVALAYLYTKVNPLIVYSSEYTVWSSMIAAWLFITWMGLRGSDAMRPTALQRIYSLLWIYAAGFVLLVFATVGENNFHLAGAYPIVLFLGSASVALLFAFMEMFALSKKRDYASQMQDPDDAPGTRPPTSGTNHRSVNESEGYEDDATETTSLLRGDRTSFTIRSPRQPTHDDENAPLPAGYDKAYGEEQPWSSKLPSSIWLFQFLVLGPINVILVGQIALQITSGLHQTGADGSSSLIVYLLVAVLTVLLLVPITPFIHRFHYQIPTFFLLVLVGTVIYNLVAFPFSPNSRLKMFFLQRVDCDTGNTTVSLTGVNGFVQNAIHSLPSASKSEIHCTLAGKYLGRHDELTSCVWPGLPAHPVPQLPSNSTTVYTRRKYEKTWFEFDTKRTDKGAALFEIHGRNTRNCRIQFDKPISKLQIEGAAQDSRFKTIGESGTREVRLWSRTWDGSWNVTVEWDENEGTKDDDDSFTQMTYHGKQKILPRFEKDDRLTGSVVCLWADANVQGAIPALEEVWRFLPNWAIVTKASDGLVEGWKKFEV